jgi:hypothetical protein
MASSKMVGFDHSSYYLPNVVSKTYSKPSEQLEPIVEPFKSRKPLIFHRGATGFTHELPDDAAPSKDSPDIETRLELSPIPGTRIYLSSKPRTHMTLAPAKSRLDLMNGNENLNRARFDKLP